MAEHYGEVPKRFSKAWWPYFWMYYKWHTIATVFVIVSVLATVVQCVTSEKYDIHMVYAGVISIKEDKLAKLADNTEPFIDDVDGNGEKNILIQQMNFSGTPSEWDSTLWTKLDMELNDEISYIFIYDEKIAQERFNQKHAAEVYLPVSEWAGDVPDELCLKTEDGVARAVCLKDSRMLDDAGIVRTDEMYIAVKQNYKKSSESKAAQKCSIEAAKKIIE